MSSSSMPSGAETTDRPRRSMIRRIALWVAVLLPSSIYLSVIPEFGRLQTNDYYAVITQVVGDDGASFTQEPLTWLRIRSNEHRVVIPALVYLANYHLTKGSNAGLSLFSLAMMLICALLLLSWLAKATREDDGAFLVLGFLITAFCFTPVAAHNVMRGFSGSQWLLSNAISVGALTLLLRRADARSLVSLWPIPVLGVAGALTYSTSISLWPALLYAAWRLGLGRRKLWLLAGASALVLGLYAMGYKSPPHDIELNTHAPTLAIEHFLIYLGSVFSKKPIWAISLGALGVLLSLGLHLTAGRPRPWHRLELREIAPFLALQIYAVGNALATSVGRSELGPAQSMASRYATIACFFWIGLLAPLGIALLRRQREPERKTPVLKPLVILGAGLAIAAMLHRGLPVLQALVQLSHAQGIAELALVHEVPDEDVLRGTVSPRTDQVYKLVPFFRNIGHVPFDIPARPWPSGNARSMGFERAGGDIQGAMDSIAAIDEDLYRIGGWLHAPSLEVRGIVLLGERRRLIGPAVTGLVRRDIGERFGREALYSGWSGYVRLPPGSRVVRAWALFEGDPKGYELAVSSKIETWWQSRIDIPDQR